MTEYIKLCDVCDFQGGSQPPKDEWSFDLKDGYIRMLQIRDFTQNEKVAPEYIKITKTTKTCGADDILIARYGASLGKILTGLAGAYNVAIMRTIPDTNVLEKKYLYYYLKSPVFQRFLLNVGSRAAQAGFNKYDLQELLIPNITRNEQVKIVGILERVETVIEARQKELQKLDDLIKARFVEMFSNNNYLILKWCEVFNTTTGRLDSNASVENGKYPFFTCSKDILKIDSYAFDQKALLLAGNNAAGKYDVKYYSGKFNAYQRTYVLGLKDNWSYQLFKYQLEDKLTYLQQQSLGGLTKYLTMKILEQLDFIVPPIEKQLEFDDFVKQVDKSKLAVQQSLEKTQQLFDSLMQKYFG